MQNRCILPIRKRRLRQETTPPREQGRLAGSTRVAANGGLIPEPLSLTHHGKLYSRCSAGPVGPGRLQRQWVGVDPVIRKKGKVSGKGSVLFLVIWFVLMVGAGQTACASDTTRHSLKSHILYATFGGKENFGSLNYAHIFSSGKKLVWAFSIGLQPFHLDRELSIPLSICAFTQGRLHHLEVDLTATFFMDKFHPNNAIRQEDFNKQLYITPFLCYRLQGRRGLVVKTGVGPQLLLDPPSKNVLDVSARVLRPSFFGSLGFSF
ncbi:hypothetical protein HRH25_09960 [Flavisolibacter sp. BT320]|nr:hypothetical protein [Flavisolibacter longurius]